MLSGGGEWYPYSVQVYPQKGPETSIDWGTPLEGTWDQRLGYPPSRRDLGLDDGNTVPHPVDGLTPVKTLPSLVLGTRAVMKFQTNVMRGYFWMVILSIWISIIIYMSWTSLVHQMKEISCAVIFEQFADASTRYVVQYRCYLYWANGAWYGSLEYHSSNPHSPWVLSIEPPCIDFLVAFLCKSARSIVLAGKWNMTKTSSPSAVVRFHLTINSSSIAVLMSVCTE